MKKKPVVVDKSWGYEEWLCNEASRGYCGKRMVMEPGGSTSYHYHKNKDEHFYVVSGVMRLYTGTVGMVEEVHILYPGDIFHVKPLHVHKIMCDGESNLEFFEFSTFHEESDSYRIPIPEVT